MDTSKKSFIEQLKKFSNGMFTTKNSDGRLHTRPMVIVKVDKDCKITLISDQDDAKVKELEKDGHVAFSGQDDVGCYLTLSGTAKLKQDSSQVKDLWRSEFDAWFPEGPEKALLIEIEPQEGECWDISGESRVKYAYELIKAKICDDKAEAEKYRDEASL